MEVSAAHDLLGTTPAMSAPERRAIYHKQRHALENHLVETTVPLLKERYRIALARLDEAFAAVVIAGASEELPVLRGLQTPGAEAQPLSAPGLARPKQPPSTAAIWRELPYAAPAATNAATAGAPKIPSAAASAAASPETPAIHPGPNLPIHPPTSSGSIWRDLPDAGAGAETPLAPSADEKPPASPAFTPTPSTALPFLSPAARGSATPSAGNPVASATSTATPSHGAHVLNPIDAHVRVQSRTPSQGAPILPATSAAAASAGPRPSGPAPVVPPTIRPAPRILPWLLMLLLLGTIFAAIAWRIATH